MKTIEMTKAPASLAKYAREATKEAVILTDSGKPIAALVPIENADLETATLSTHPKFLALIEHSRACQKLEEGFSSEEMRRRLGQKRTARKG